MVSRRVPDVSRNVHRARSAWCPLARLRVYIASKLADAPLWRSLREAWPEVEFTARWPVCHVGTTPDTEGFAKIFWDHDLADVGAYDVVLVYTASRTYQLRGALVEVGMGLALGKEIVVVGNHPDYGTWQHHRNVHHASDLDEARKLLETMAMSL